ncbi:MAG TPA: helix-turn-helix domain-containing protein [Minicystis sp.]|nr:helix-turn-helix domain-containing protein [Minicystis sp.]
MTTYKIEELAREADVTPRTVRYYVQRGLLPPPDFRGSQTTYGPAHLLRLRIVKRLQQEHVPLDEIAARLAGAGIDQLERLLSDAHSTHRVSSHAGSPYRQAPIVAPAAGPVPAPPGRAEAWERVELLPGVELHVRADASPLARRVAREILSSYGPGPARARAADAADPLPPEEE